MTGGSSAVSSVSFAMSVAIKKKKAFCVFCNERFCVDCSVRDGYGLTAGMLLDTRITDRWT